MIELERHIEILLLNNDCVIVPGLGGFTANHVPARYEEHENMFLPPLRTLGFNPRLNTNDFLLVQSFSEAYDISYPEAYARIESDTNEIRQQLNNEGSYELNDIGVLYLNEDGNIEFTPCEAGILTPSLYGLSSFEMDGNTLPVAQEKRSDGNEKVMAVSFNTSPIDAESQGIQEQEASDETTEEAEMSDEKVLRVKYSMIRNVCVCIISIILFFALATPVNNNDTLKLCNIDNGIIQRLISNGVDRMTNKEETSLKTAETKAEVAKETNATETNLDADKQQTKAQESYYCLVLASKVAKKNAELFVKRLQKEGFDNASVLSENKSIKVIYGHYKSLNEAYNSLNCLKINEHFYEAWVYQVKN